MMAGLLISSVWLLTAGILAWLGLILGPEDQEGIDGVARLLFTVVPIRVFSWTMAVLFLWMGILTANRVFRGDPTLVICAEGLRLRSGRQVRWKEIDRIEVRRNGMLEVVMVGSRELPQRNRLWKRFARAQSENDRRPILLSPFELGAAPTKVAKEVQERLNEAGSRRHEV